MRHKRKTKERKKNGVYFHAEKMGCVQERIRDEKVNIHDENKYS